jgi:hypothetical protein
LHHRSMQVQIASSQEGRQPGRWRREGKLTAQEFKGMANASSVAGMELDGDEDAVDAASCAIDAAREDIAVLQAVVSSLKGRTSPEAIRISEDAAARIKQKSLVITRAKPLREQIKVTEKLLARKSEAHHTACEEFEAAKGRMEKTHSELLEATRAHEQVASELASEEAAEALPRLPTAVQQLAGLAANFTEAQIQVIVALMSAMAGGNAGHFATVLQAPPPPAGESQHSPARLAQLQGEAQEQTPSGRIRSPSLSRTPPSIRATRGEPTPVHSQGMPSAPAPFGRRGRGRSVPPGRRSRTPTREVATLNHGKAAEVVNLTSSQPEVIASQSPAVIAAAFAAATPVFHLGAKEPPRQ